ncbi:Prefoldin subunit beta [Candidatus Gugararchaeum adminiculabundum]|nr:Prefoldin subunit beta [Candidatus Gugararchaeum adminiculabundum]
MAEVGKEFEKEVAEFQVLQRQLQTIMMQKQQAKVEGDEAKGALDLLKKGGEVYMARGPILVKTSKAEAEKELGEKTKFLETRVSILDKQEEKAKGRLNELKKVLEEASEKAGAN